MTGASNGHSNTKSTSGADETIYLCKFRVSVDGDWLCLKELDDEMMALTKARNNQENHRRCSSATPELEHVRYPDYPVGNRTGRELNGSPCRINQ